MGFFEPTGQLILTYSQGLGLVTKNVEEMTALWKGLNVAKERGNGDSQIITSYMVRKSKIRKLSLLIPITKSRLYCIAHILTKIKFVKSIDLH